jgi:hypothetical protein
MWVFKLKLFCSLAAGLAMGWVCYAQDAAADKPGVQQSEAVSATAAPSVLPVPAMPGPLQFPSRISFEAGPLGKWNLNGIASGTALFQNNSVPGNNSDQFAINSGQLILQKADGWWQVYLQAGAYNIVSLGTPHVSTQTAIDNLFGPLPVAYLKLVPANNTSVMIGKLPTLLGDEYTFDFENVNIERGLLWNQTAVITRGVQLNQMLGKFTASFSWNDGYYSSRYSALDGSLTYVSGPHSVSFIAGGNLSTTNWTTLATPIQNSGLLFDLIYTYAKGNWMVQPYVQQNSVAANPALGALHGASAWGGAVLVNRNLGHGMALAGRWEYISTSGSTAQQSANLLYGPGSAAWSITVTPALQYKHLFARGDVSYVRALDPTPGSAFGSQGTSQGQTRGVIELGFIF